MAGTSGRRRSSPFAPGAGQRDRWHGSLFPAPCRCGMNRMQAGSGRTTGPRTSARRLASSDSRRRVCCSVARSVSHPTNVDTSSRLLRRRERALHADGELRPRGDQGIRRRLSRKRHPRIDRRVVEVERAVKRKLGAALRVQQVALVRRICPAAIVTFRFGLRHREPAVVHGCARPQRGFSAHRSSRSDRPARIGGIERRRIDAGELRLGSVIVPLP